LRTWFIQLHVDARCRKIDWVNPLGRLARFDMQPRGLSLWCEVSIARLRSTAVEGRIALEKRRVGLSECRCVGIRLYGEKHRVPSRNWIALASRLKTALLILSGASEPYARFRIRAFRSDEGKSISSGTSSARANFNSSKSPTQRAVASILAMVSRSMSQPRR
jgi:hypothetical protein